MILESEEVTRGKGSIAWYIQGRRLPRFSTHAFSCICFVDVGEASSIQQSAWSAKGRTARGIILAGGGSGSSQCSSVNIAFDCLGERRAGFYRYTGYRIVGVRLLI